VKKYGKRYKSAVDCLLEGLPDCLTFFRFPSRFWKRIRTSNPLERTFKEVRRRTKVVGRFPTESSALAVIYGILSIEAVKWRGLTFGPATIVEIHQVSEKLKTEPIVLDLEQEAA